LPNGCGGGDGSAVRTRCRGSSPIPRCSPTYAPSPWRTGHPIRFAYAIPSKSASGRKPGSTFQHYRSGLVGPGFRRNPVLELAPARLGAQEPVPDGDHQQHQEHAEKPERRQRLLFLLLAADPHAGPRNLAAATRLGAPEPVAVGAELELPVVVGPPGQRGPVRL